MREIKEKQLEFLDWEFGAFFNFGIRTFYEGHVDWDMKEMPLEGFLPTQLDCEQWIRTIKEAGASYAVFERSLGNKKAATAVFALCFLICTFTVFAVVI